MKFSRTKADAIQKISGDGVFAVLHTRRDFGKDNIPVGEKRVAFGNLTERAGFWPNNSTTVFRNGGHLNERRWRVGCPVKFWSARIQFANLAQFHHSPAVARI